MKRTFNKHALGFLVLAAAGLPLMAQAADSATVTIKATVAATYSVTVPTTPLNITNFSAGNDIDITINTNATSAKLTLDAGDKHEGDKLKLVKDADNMLLKTTLDGADLKLTGNKMSKTISVTPNTPKVVKLHVTPDAGADKLPAGTYEGSVTLRVDAA